jgi:hypothetical protein
MFSGQRNVLLAFVLVGLYMLHYEMLLHPATNMILATVSVAIVLYTAFGNWLIPRGKQKR